MINRFEQSPHFNGAVAAFDDAVESQSKSAWLKFAERLADVFTVAWCEGAVDTLKAAGVGVGVADIAAKSTSLPGRPTVADCRRAVEMSSAEWQRLTASSLDAAVEVAAYEAAATADIDETVAMSRRIVVVRTNAARAFHQGQMTAGMLEAVMARVPLYRYTAKMDARTRPTHRQMNGYLASPHDINSSRLETPCGFNCRCKWSPVTMSEAKRLGLIGARGSLLRSAVSRRNGSRESLVRQRLFPDPGFKA